MCLITTSHFIHRQDNYGKQLLCSFLFSTDATFFRVSIFPTVVTNHVRSSKFTRHCSLLLFIVSLSRKLPAAITISLKQCNVKKTAWATAHMLELNDNKTELMLVTSKRTKHLHNIPTSITMEHAQIPFKQSVKNLGFTLDCHLTMNTHSPCCLMIICLPPANQVCVAVRKTPASGLSPQHDRCVGFSHWHRLCLRCPRLWLRTIAGISTCGGSVAFPWEAHPYGGNNDGV